MTQLPLEEDEKMVKEIRVCARKPTASAALVAAAMCVLFCPVAAGEVELPPVERAVLENGMTVLVMEDARLPLVNMRLGIWGGSASDPAGAGGLCSLTADLIRKGAGVRSAVEVAELVEFMGGELDSYAEHDYSVIEAEFLAGDFEDGLGLLGDIVLRPAFAPEEFQREKAKTLGRLEQVPDDPYDLADREFNTFLLGDHPYAHPTDGTLSSVRTIGLEHVRDYHDRFYRPQMTVLVIVGDVKQEEALTSVREVFGEWERRGEDRVAVPTPSPGEGGKILLIDKPDATQTQIRIGNLAVSRGHEDFLPFYVANVLFGGGFTSRLIEEIRVNRGLSYSPRSRFYSMSSGGIFVIKEYTRNEQAMETIEVTLDLVKGLRENPIPPEELAKTKSYVNGLFPLRLERPESLARELLEIEFYGLGDDYIEGFPEAVGGIGAGKLSEVARKYVAYDDLTFTIIGVASELQEPLSKYGEVEVRRIRRGGEGPQGHAEDPQRQSPTD